MHILMLKYTTKGAGTNLQTLHWVGQQLLSEFVGVYQHHANVLQLGTGQGLVVLSPVLHKRVLEECHVYRNGNNTWKTIVHMTVSIYSTDSAFCLLNIRKLNSRTNCISYQRYACTYVLSIGTGWHSVRI